MDSRYEGSDRSPCSHSNLPASFFEAEALWVQGHTHSSRTTNMARPGSSRTRLATSAGTAQSRISLRPPACDQARSHPCPGLSPIQATRLRVTRCSYGLTCRQAAATVSKPSSCRSCSRRRLAPLGASSTARAVERLLGSQALGPARLPQLRSTETALPRRSAAVFLRSAPPFRADRGWAETPQDRHRRCWRVSSRNATRWLNS